MIMIKSLQEIVRMSSEELIEYYTLLHMYSDTMMHNPEEFLGVMTQEELISKYQLIQNSGAIEITDWCFNLTEYLEILQDKMPETNL